MSPIVTRTSSSSSSLSLSLSTSSPVASPVAWQTKNKQRNMITTNVFVLQEQITVSNGMNFYLEKKKKTATEHTCTQHILCACELPTSEATPFPVACAPASSVEASAGALWIQWKDIRVLQVHIQIQWHFFHDMRGTYDIWLMLTSTAMLDRRSYGFPYECRIKQLFFTFNKQSLLSLISPIERDANIKQN